MIRSPSLRSEWPLITLELQEFYISVTHLGSRGIKPSGSKEAPADFSITPIYSVPKIEVKSGPVFIRDHNSEPVFAIATGDGSIEAHSLLRKQNVWSLPIHLEDLRTGGFIHMSWHVEHPEPPVLNVYWIPPTPIFRSAKLHRLKTRLYSDVISSDTFDLSPKGRVQGILSFDHDQEFLHWSSADGRFWLADLNHQNSLTSAVAFTPANFSRRGSQLWVTRIDGDRLQVLKYRAGQWQLKWQIDCRECTHPAMYATDESELWVAYSQRAVGLSIRNFRDDQPSKSLLEPRRPSVAPLFFQSADGRLLIFAEFQNRIEVADLSEARKSPQFKAITPEGASLTNPHPFESGASTWLAVSDRQGSRFYPTAPRRASARPAKSLPYSGVLTELDGQLYLSEQADSGPYSGLNIYKIGTAP